MQPVNLAPWYNLLQPCINRAKGNTVDVCCRDPNYKVRSQQHTILHLLPIVENLCRIPVRKRIPGTSMKILTGPLMTRTTTLTTMTQSLTLIFVARQRRNQEGAESLVDTGNRHKLQLRTNEWSITFCFCFRTNFSLGTPWMFCVIGFKGSAAQTAIHCTIFVHH